MRLPALDQLHERAVQRHGHPLRLGRAHDGAVDHVDLRLPPRLEVLEHRRLRRPRLLEQRVDRVDALLRVDVVAQATRDGDRLARGLAHQLVHGGVRGERPGVHPGQRGGRERRRVEDQLLPDLGPHRRGDAHLEPTVRERLREPGRAGVVGLSLRERAHDRRLVGGVHDPARALYEATVVRDADDDLLLRVDAGEHVAVAPSVLERRDDRLGTDERPGGLGRGGGVVALREEDDEVDRPDRRRIGRRRDAGRGLLLPANDRDAFRVDRLDERGDHVHEHGVVPPAREPGAQDRAHRARAHDGDLHRSLLCGSSGMRSYRSTDRGGTSARPHSLRRRRATSAR